MLPTEQSESRVLVGEKLDLPTQTVAGLFEVLQKVFQQKDRPIRIQYVRGEPLLVERMVSRAGASESMLSPYEMVRNHAELRVLDTAHSALEGLARASAELRGTLSCIVVRDVAEFVASFPPGLNPGKVLHVPIHEDSNCPADLFFVCASSTGRMLLEVDEAVACYLEDL
jgi:hypothetical protein